MLTNQYIINAQIITIEQYQNFQEKLLDALKSEGIEILSTYYCPHTDEEKCIITIALILAVIIAVNGAFTIPFLGALFIASILGMIAECLQDKSIRKIIAYGIIGLFSLMIMGVILITGAEITTIYY